jgi:hypothetical protein
MRNAECGIWMRDFGLQNLDLGLGIADFGLRIIGEYITKIW